MKSSMDSILFKLRIVILEIIVLSIVIIIVGICKHRAEASKTYTREDPYIIASTEDFVDFANMVQDGYSFNGEYVLMTEDIDLEDVWVPAMGIPGSGHYFEGTFDGGGHRIYNIYMGVDEGDYSLFGTLGGTVMNLGIEPGVIQGDTCGGIASHSVDESARIINCYNKAYIYGKYAGGIAGNFDGKIINCVSMCKLYGEYGYGNIIAYGNSLVVNSFSVYHSGRGDTHNGTAQYVRFFTDGDKFSEISQFMPLIRDELNSSSHILAIECPDIPAEDIHLWKESDDGQDITFSEYVASSSIMDRMISGILYELKEHYPFSPICIVVLVFINILLLTDGIGRMNFIQNWNRSHR